MDARGILPTPIPDRDSEHYWEALGQGRFELQRCGDCRHWTWPPRPVCSGCHGERLGWEEVSGTGEVHGWIVTHQVYGPGYGALVPYTVVLVRLDEQPDLLVPGRFTSEVEVHQGLRVRVVCQPVGDGLGVPEWEALGD
jgi:uncharacterized OB-fold protein